MAKQPESGPVGGRGNRSHPNGWSSDRIEQAPKARKGGTPDGYPLGLDNSTRAALNTVKGIIRKISGK